MAAGRGSQEPIFTAEEVNAAISYVASWILHLKEPESMPHFRSESPDVHRGAIKAI